MQPRVQHLIETRFSVRLFPGQDGFSPEWLARRVDLWRRFCLPSVAAQSVGDFTWLLLCDESTDPEVLAALRSAESEVPGLELAMTAVDRTPGDVVRSRVRTDADVLITTCLDSDDALADRFVESVQAYAGPFARSAHGTLAVNFPRGYRLDAVAGELYEDWLPASSFPSLLERPGRRPVETVLETNHVLLRHSHPTQQDESLHAWLIAVHGGNVVNRIGPRSLPAVAAASIPGFHAGVAAPLRSEAR